jgi:RHH-type proline utilization regulon transcriptional repressor/proline dehydrogenase/delta 1-pyrroline-5-carboxylate dehydrogenase
VRPISSKAARDAHRIGHARSGQDANAVGEVREAADFCRYYAAQARRELDSARALGPIACIAPWNFPLAIFVGQVSAALAAGIPVLAKPAEQTPLIAAAAVQLFHRAGVPLAALRCFLDAANRRRGAGHRSAHWGVLFRLDGRCTNHQSHARAARRRRCWSPGPRQNAMIVDGSALSEQVVSDAITSAFSADQRCSALRILCLQEDIADRVMEMLKVRCRNCASATPRSSRLASAQSLMPTRRRCPPHVAQMRAAGADIFN